MKNGCLEIGIFISCIITLLAYLFSFRWHIYLPIYFFWLPIILILGTILHQSLYCKLSPFYSNLVVLEIAITCIIFHLIYQIPCYGLYGSDSYWDLSIAKGILHTGSLLGDSNYISVCSYFPMIHILGTFSSMLTGTSLFVTAKWLPSILNIPLIILLYLFILKIFKDKTIALLSILLFAALEHYMQFSSLFIRETIALVLITCSLYLYFSANNNFHQLIFLSLTIICLIGLVFAHHLSSLMLFIFFLIHFIIIRIKDLNFLKNRYSINDVKGKSITASFLVFFLLMIMSYWIYVIFSPLYSLISFVMDLISQEKMTSYAEIANISPVAIISLRGLVIYYGFHFFLLIFGAILSYQLITRSRTKIAEVYSFTMFLFLCGFIGLIGLYFSNTLVNPDRFLAYGWITGFPPLVYAILKTETNRFRQAGLTLLAIFLLFNIYMIHPGVWDKQYEGILPSPTEQNYMLVKNFDLSNESLGSDANTKMAFFDVYNDPSAKYIYSKNEIVNLSSLAWIIIDKKSLYLEEKYGARSKIKSFSYIVKLLSYGDHSRNKIYDSFGLAAFRENAQ